MIFSTVIKAVLIIAIPITLVVYACLYVGARCDDAPPQEPHHCRRQ